MCLMVLPDGRLASGGKDPTIKVWDVLGDAAALTLSGHSGSVEVSHGLAGRVGWPAGVG